jgi:nucleotide-binding universal stress UspA family protein
MFERILIPTDGSKLADKASRAAVAMAKSEGASVVGFHALPSYEQSTYQTVAVSPGWITEEKFNKLNKQAAKKYLDAVEKLAHEAGVPYEGYTLTRKHAALAIVEAVKDKRCDLIFIGSHGRGDLAQVFLGSVTTKVLSLCSIPVLVYRSGPAKSRKRR